MTDLIERMEAAAEIERQLADCEMLDAIAANYWTLTTEAIHNGYDADVAWVVIEHRMGKPNGRAIGGSIQDDPRQAIRAALQEDKNDG